MDETRKEQSLEFVTLHDAEGTPLTLRRAFIMAALGKHDKRPLTQVTVDEGNNNRIYQVQESLDEIKGPFARVGGILINPAYVSSIGEKNTGSEAEKFPYVIRFKAPEPLSYITTTKQATFLQAIQEASAQGPC